MAKVVTGQLTARPPSGRNCERLETCAGLLGQPLHLLICIGNVVEDFLKPPDRQGLIAGDKQGCGICLSGLTGKIGEC